MLADRGRCCNETQKNGQGVRKLNTVQGGAGARREGGEEVVVGWTVGLWRPMEEVVMVASVQSHYELMKQTALKGRGISLSLRKIADSFLSVADDGF